MALRVVFTLTPVAYSCIDKVSGSQRYFFLFAIYFSVQLCYNLKVRKNGRQEVGYEQNKMVF